MSSRWEPAKTEQDACYGNCLAASFLSHCILTCGCHSGPGEGCVPAQYFGDRALSSRMHQEVLACCDELKQV